MEIDAAAVRRVAQLARLELNDAEIEAYRSQLGTILGYVEQLKGVPVEGVEPLTHAGDFSNVMREDAVKPSLAVESALSNAPKREGPFFVVPRVIAE